MNRMSDKNPQNIAAATTPAPVAVMPAKKKKAPYPFWLGGVAASIAASITQCVSLRFHSVYELTAS